MKMKRLIIGISLFILAIFPNAVRADGLGELRMTLVDGDVQLWDDEAREWVPVAINMPLREGDRLWVPEEGRAEIQSRNGTYVRLNERTGLDLLRIEQDSLQLYLSQGQVHVNFPGSRDSRVQIDAPMSTVRAYERARFGVDVFRQGDTDISVYDGEVYVESSRGRTMLREGRQLSLGDDYSDIFSLGRETSWERWNRERDSRLADRRYRDDYLPEELRYYGSDFDEYGRWVYAREHGYVWTPTFSVSVGWSPYRDGRWIWRGGDYVWLSYEPWGWVPYHYGRWTFVVNIGWCWVPPARGSVYWGPGYVGWVYTPTYVAWVPLAPREIYYGYGYYGSYSINIINITIGSMRVRHDYRNVRVRNAVIVLDHDSFRRGRRTEFRVRENPFHEHYTHMGRPRISPVRESYIPVLREIPEKKRPPRVIREVKVKEVRQERPFVKEAAAPALNPDRYEKFRRDWKRVREQDQEQEKDLQREQERIRKQDERRRVEPRGERETDGSPEHERRGRDGRTSIISPEPQTGTGTQQDQSQRTTSRRSREGDPPAVSVSPVQPSGNGAGERVGGTGGKTTQTEDAERSRRSRKSQQEVEEETGQSRRLREAEPSQQRSTSQEPKQDKKRVREKDKEKDSDRENREEEQKPQPQQQLNRESNRGEASGRYSWQEDRRNTSDRNRRDMF